MNLSKSCSSMAFLLCTAGALVGCSLSVADEGPGDEPGSMADDSSEADPGAIGSSESGLCVSDGVYRYRGTISGYPTWSQNCTGQGYQLACGSHLKRNVTVAYSGYYYLTWVGSWHSDYTC